VAVELADTQVDSTADDGEGDVMFTSENMIVLGVLAGGGESDAH
jgi:hypothetical protein